MAAARHSSAALLSPTSGAARHSTAALLIEAAAGAAALVVQGMTQGQSLEAPALTQHNTLTPNAVAQAQALDSPTLTQHSALAVDGAAQGQALASPTLTQHNTIGPDPITQQQALEAATVTPAATGFLLSLDGDNDVYDGQAAQILPRPGHAFGASGNKVEIVQGGTTVAQTVTSEGTTAIWITVNLTGLTVPGSATLRVGRPT